MADNNQKAAPVIMPLELMLSLDGGPDYVPTLLTAERLNVLLNRKPRCKV